MASPSEQQQQAPLPIQGDSAVSPVAPSTSTSVSSTASFPPASPSQSARQQGADSQSRLSSTPSTSSLRAQHGRSPSRHTSLPQGSIADLITNPPPPKSDGMAARDWRTIRVAELMDGRELLYIDPDTAVEMASQMLVEHGLSSLPVRASPLDQTVIGTFDYADLTAFLLLVIGLGIAGVDDPASKASFQEVAQQAREGHDVPVKQIKDLGKKDPFITISESECLPKVVEIFGSGVHRVAVVRESDKRVVGVLSQWRLVDFFWHQRRNLPSLEHLYPCPLRELNIGSNQVISINGDKPVSAALELMNQEGISSVAIVDNSHNVVGNISVNDVKYLTRSSSLPLLRSSCIHFLSVILADKGMLDGQDAYPVFHVSPQSTLSHTIAKLIATKAHRMWIVEAPSPVTSTPPTPTMHPSILPPPSPGIQLPITPGFPVSTSNSAVSAANNPGAHLSGRLIGVISLTDILNLFGRTVGLAPTDPSEARRRRRSSSSSVRAPSFDHVRGSFEIRRP